MNPKILVIISLLLIFTQESRAQRTNRFTNKLTPCHVTNVEEEVLCGRYEVYENRTAGTGRKISLNIVVLPATSAEVETNPFVFLAGGGVAPATRYASYFSKAFPELRKHRDILLIDQRGTGGSNPLECDVSTDVTNENFRNEARFRESVRNCRKALESKADLHYYTTPFAMDDLDDIRKWLGYPKLNLYGVSYGTKAATVYVRQHPENVRSIVMQGVLPINAPMWLEFPKSAQQALDHVFETCKKQKSCHDAFPNLEQEFNTLLKRLAEKPVKVKVTKPESKEEAEVPIDAEALRGFVPSVLFSASRIHDLPFVIHSAHAGDYQPLAQKLAFKGDSGIPKGIYFAIVCSEEIPQVDPAAVPEAMAGTFMGEFRINRELIACSEWIRGTLPEKFWTPVQSNVPALVMSGSLDHVTPPRYGDQVAKSLNNSRHVVLPNRGHNDTDPCVSEIIQGFVAAGSLQGLDTSCLAKSEDLSFALSAGELNN
jgi:pimeloyl-ACP methyl ester carboxylesterase